MADAEPDQFESPIRTGQAADIDDYARHIAACAGDGRKLIDYGTFHRGMGHAPTEPGVHIAPPIGVLEHYVDDMAVRVTGGTRFDELSAALSEHQQALPLDAPGEMTLAEIIAHNVYGPMATSAGACRDLLLGMHYVDAAGTLIRVGGRTVKNVAGYDVTRLMVGSLNTLGLIAEATLRTVTIPPQVSRIDILGVNPAAFSKQVASLRISDAAPHWMQWQQNGDEPPRLQLAYLGQPEACRVHCEALEQWLQANGWIGVEITRREVDYTADVAERRADRTALWSSPAVVKLIVPPAAAGDVCESLVRQAPAPLRLFSLPTLGIIHVAGDMPRHAAEQLDAIIHQAIAPHAGLRVWLNRPESTDAIAPFAPPQPDWPMLAKLKQTLDPDNLFNPGRFP